MLIQLEGYPRTKRLHLFTCIEETLYGKVDQLTVGEMASREETIDRIANGHRLTLPVIDWKQASIEIFKTADASTSNNWVGRLITTLTDPENILDFVPFYNECLQEGVDIDALTESGKLLVNYPLISNYDADARLEFNRAITQWRIQIACMFREVGNFNAALPYLTACLVDLKIEHGDLGMAIHWPAR